MNEWAYILRYAPRPTCPWDQASTQQCLLPLRALLGVSLGKRGPLAMIVLLDGHQRWSFDRNRCAYSMRPSAVQRWSSLQVIIAKRQCFYWKLHGQVDSHSCWCCCCYLHHVTHSLPFSKAARQFSPVYVKPTLRIQPAIPYRVGEVHKRQSPYAVQLRWTRTHVIGGINWVMLDRKRDN